MNVKQYSEMMMLWTAGQKQQLPSHSPRANRPFSHHMRWDCTYPAKKNRMCNVAAFLVPPPPGISYALVQATVGVGTVIIV